MYMGVNLTSGGLEVKSPNTPNTKYAVYDRMNEKIRIGDMTVVKDEIMDYIVTYMEYYVSDVLVEMKAFQVDLDKRKIGASDITMLNKQKQVIDKIIDLVIAFIRVETSNSAERMIKDIEEVLAVEKANDILNDEIESLKSKGRTEDAEILSRCIDPIWIGFGHDDEYGTIICEVR